MFEAVRDFREGFAFHVKGIRFAFHHLSFMLLSTLPFLITLSLYILGFYMFTQYADDLLHVVWRMDAGESSKYIGWLYWAFMHIVKLFLYLIALVVMFYMFIVFSNILASPVYDHIVSKYERIRYQPAHEEQTKFTARALVTVVKEEIKKAMLMLFIPLPLVFIPVIGGLLGFVLAAAFIAWDYIDFSLSRDYPIIKDRIKVLWRHKFLLLGFGCPLLIPFIGLIILPFAILGSTKLYFDKIKGPAHLNNSFKRSSGTFWGTHPGEANGPPWWANRKLFEALRPSFCDLVSEPIDGSKSSWNRVQRSYSNVSAL